MAVNAGIELIGTAVFWFLLPPGFAISRAGCRLRRFSILRRCCSPANFLGSGLNNTVYYLCCQSK